jgi:hypothetical protein
MIRDANATNDAQVRRGCVAAVNEGLDSTDSTYKVPVDADGDLRVSQEKSATKEPSGVVERC